MDTQIYNVVIVGPEVHFKVRSAGKHYDFALTEGALAACARQIGQDVHEDLAKLEVFEQYEDNIRPIVMDILDQVEQQDTDAFVIDTPDIDIAINNGALAVQQRLAGKN